MARNFQKYAVYGVGIKVVPKEFFPESTSTENVRAIHSGTTTDMDSSGTAYDTEVPPQQLMNQGDYKFTSPRDPLQRYYKVGVSTKNTAGQFWYDCSLYFDDSANSKLTFPSKNMNRATCLTWELSSSFPASTFIAKIEVTYYVMFKQRKYAQRT